MTWGLSKMCHPVSGYPYDPSMYASAWFYWYLHYRFIVSIYTVATIVPSMNASLSNNIRDLPPRDWERGAVPVPVPIPVPVPVPVLLPVPILFTTSMHCDVLAPRRRYAPELLRLTEPPLLSALKFFISWLLERKSDWNRGRGRDCDTEFLLLLVALLRLLRLGSVGQLVCIIVVEERFKWQRR